MGRRVRERVDKLEQGREAYARRAWLEAYDSLTRAHEHARARSAGPRAARDLRLHARSRRRVGRVARARASAVPRGRRDAPRSSLRGVDRLEPRVPRPDRPRDRMARTGTATPRERGRVRRARISALAGGVPARGSRGLRRGGRGRAARRFASPSASATGTCSPSQSRARATC